jgi:hypothetical protein
VGGIIFIGNDFGVERANLTNACDALLTVNAVYIGCVAAEKCCIRLHINLHSAAKASAQIEMKADGWRRNLIFILYTIYEERQTTTHVEVSRRGTSC